MVFLNAKGELMFLFMLEAVESWTGLNLDAKKHCGQLIPRFLKVRRVRTAGVLALESRHAREFES